VIKSPLMLRVIAPPKIKHHLWKWRVKQRLISPQFLLTAWRSINIYRPWLVAASHVIS